MKFSGRSGLDPYEVPSIMSVDQDEEIMNYIHLVAPDLRQPATRGSLEINAEEQRREYLRQIVRSRREVRNALEVGCGDGEALLDLARAGVKTVGVNLVPNQLTKAHQKAALAGAELIYSSVFEYTPDIRFDLISTNGFLEHISANSFIEFVAHAKNLLAEGGSLVITCYNRLYNAFALNLSTRTELSKGVMHKLIVEAMIFSNQETMAQTIEELLATDDLMPSVNRQVRSDSNAAEKGHYTPGQIVRLLKDFGITCVELYPLDYRGAAPRFALDHAEAQADICSIVHRRAFGSHYLIPFSSYFMVHAMLI